MIYGLLNLVERVQADWQSVRSLGKADQAAAAQRSLEEIVPELPDDIRKEHAKGAHLQPVQQLCRLRKLATVALQRENARLDDLIRLDPFVLQVFEAAVQLESVSPPETASASAVFYFANGEWTAWSLSTIARVAQDLDRAADKLGCKIPVCAAFIERKGGGTVSDLLWHHRDVPDGAGQYQVMAPALGRLPDGCDPAADLASLDRDRAAAVGLYNTTLRNNFRFHLYKIRPDLSTELEVIMDGKAVWMDAVWYRPAALKRLLSQAFLLFSQIN